jgi:hypothetical protein
MDSEGVKDIIGEAKDNLGVPGKVLMKLVRENMDPGVIEADLAELENTLAISVALNNPTPTTTP